MRNHAFDKPTRNLEVQNLVQMSQVLGREFRGGNACVDLLLELVEAAAERAGHGWQ